MSSIVEVDNLSIEVTRKKVKNLNLRVYPSSERVVLSCPRFTREIVIKKFIREKKRWIEKKLRKGKDLPKREPKKFVTGEKHLIWGKEAVLNVYETTRKQHAKKEDDGSISLYIRSGKTVKQREKVIREWYRGQLKEEISLLIKKWEPIMNVSVNEFGVKKMKTRWGTCNVSDKRIWLNLELAKRPYKCLEYIVVHEMVHLHERLHNKRFYRYMDRYLPDWRSDDECLRNRPL